MQVEVRSKFLQQHGVLSDVVTGLTKAPGIVTTPDNDGEELNAVAAEMVSLRLGAQTLRERIQGILHGKSTI